MTLYTNHIRSHYDVVSQGVMALASINSSVKEWCRQGSPQYYGAVFLPSF